MDAYPSGDRLRGGWPDPQLKADEREGQRAAVYRLTITNMKNNESARYRVSESDWNGLREGEDIYFTVKRSGGEPCISDAKGNPLVELKKD